MSVNVKSTNDAAARERLAALARCLDTSRNFSEPVTMSRFPGHDFFHARLTIDGRIGLAFFFADRGLGCMAILDGQVTKFGRLRVCHGPRGGDPSRN